MDQYTLDEVLEALDKLSESLKQLSEQLQGLLDKENVSEGKTLYMENVEPSSQSRSESLKELAEFFRGVDE
jgi:uncharacterized protein YoxC